MKRRAYYMKSFRTYTVWCDSGWYKLHKKSFHHGSKNEFSARSQNILQVGVSSWNIKETSEIVQFYIYRLHTTSVCLLKTSNRKAWLVWKCKLKTLWNDYSQPNIIMRCWDAAFVVSKRHVAGMRVNQQIKCDYQKRLLHGVMW